MGIDDYLYFFNGYLFMVSYKSALNINNYFEIYIQVEQSVLHNRDSKGLYQRYYNKETNNVVGEDIPFHEPENPWITIDNNGEKTPDKIVDQIMLAIKKDKILV